MRTLTPLLLSCAVVALLLAGCDGSSPSGDGGDPGRETSSIEGWAEIEGDASNYVVLLDGQEVPATLQADGSYLIEGVPPGQRRVAVVARDGMVGGYATVDVPRNERARAPDIMPRPGGQIAGIVSVIEDGTLRVLEGVEVTARPAVVIGRDEAETPGIYPPPDELETYSAFTDSRGSYVIPAVPRGEYVVTVHAAEMMSAWQWVWVEALSTAAADFRLHPMVEDGVGTVRGIVYRLTSARERVPIGGAKVTITTESPWEPGGPIEMPPGPPAAEPGRDGDGEENGAHPGWPGPDVVIMPPWIDMVSTITRADGSYTLNAPAGRATIEVYMPGYASVWRDIVIVAEETLNINFELRPWNEVPPPPPDPDWPVEPDHPTSDPPAPPATL